MARWLATMLGLAVVGVATMAGAAPPTAQHNPGYERRLQESRQHRVQPPPEFRAPLPRHRHHGRRRF